MSSHLKDGGKKTAGKSMAYAIILTLFAMAPFFLSLEQPSPSTIYFMSATALSLYILTASAKFLWTKDRNYAAKKLFHATIIYLPILLLALVADRYM